MKIIAFYLPQFHEIPENNDWWGQGFTEWTNMKTAKPLFKDHRQPRVPLNNNYYNLLNENTLSWQIDLAKKYGVYGFCFYHYWFDGHMLLQKPMEIMRDSENINFPYCISWANEAWTNAWKSNGDVKTLIKQRYGGPKEWKEHFNYLLKFFMDENYIKEDGKPLFVLYRPEICDCLNPMLSYWDTLAKDAGLLGLCFAYQQISYFLQPNKDESMFSYRIEYQPTYARYDIRTNSQSGYLLTSIKNSIRNCALSIDKKFGTNLYSKLSVKKLTFENYNELCEAIVTRQAVDDKSIAGFFVDWDNTPRRGKTGSVCLGSSPAIFRHYLKKQIKNVQENYKNDYLFVFAWNEWAEGGYLEPDEENKYGFLEAIKECINE